MYQEGYQGELTLWAVCTALGFALALLPGIWAGLLWLQDRRR
jgi:hypothetical protein